MKRISAFLAVAFILTIASQAQAGTMCKDGYYSNSSGSGTCSHHGGEG